MKKKFILGFFSLFARLQQNKAILYPNTMFVNNDAQQFRQNQYQAPYNVYDAYNNQHLSTLQNNETLDNYLFKPQQKYLIQTTYADPSRIMYNKFIPLQNEPINAEAIIQEQHTLDSLKAEIHNQILIHANELECIEYQLQEAEYQKKESSSDYSTNELNNMIKLLNKQKVLTIKILNKALKQERSIAERQKDLYKGIDFKKKYKINNKSTKIKSNQKISKNDRKEIKAIIKQYPNIEILIKPSTRQPNLFNNQQGSIIAAEQIKSTNNYIDQSKYITDQTRINFAAEILNKNKSFIRSQINNINNELSSKIEKPRKIFLKHEKENLQSELKRIKKQIKNLKAREIELEKFGNYHFKYTISYNGSVPSEIRVNQELTDEPLSTLSKVFAKYNNLTLFIKPQR